jgi:antitoxin component of MazEF toxin-antitoxin module
MHRQIQQSSNSKTVSLPENMLDTLGIQEGSDVSVLVDKKNHQIIIDRLLISLQQR